MESITDQILEWIQLHPGWAGLVIFAIAFLESLAIVGLAMPGWLLLVGVGTLIGTGHLNFYEMAAFSFAGAAAGQGLSYLVGYKFQHRVHHWSWVERHQGLMKRAERFFRRHGVAGIVVGQFIGPIRAVISLLAGILNMPPKRFLFAMLGAALIWAPLYLLPGVAVGAALTYEKQQMWVLLGILAVTGVCFWLLARYFSDYIKHRKFAQKGYDAGISRRLLLTKTSVVVVVLVSLSAFLIFTRYGQLMLNLMSKILQVIS